MQEGELDLEHQVLLELYNKTADDLGTNPWTLAAEHGLDKEAAKEFYRGLQRQGWLQLLPQSGVTITPRGQEYMERISLGRRGIIAAREACQRWLLEFALEADRENVHVTWRQAEHAFAGDRDLVYYGLRVLQGEGLLESHDETDYFWLTSAGRSRITGIHKREDLAEQLKQLKLGKDQTPQERGRAFEVILAELARLAGFEVSCNVRTPGQEDDLILWWDTECWVVSCKWEKSRAGTPYLDLLRQRLAKRGHAMGVLASMSGHSATAKKEAAITSLGAIVLLDKRDIEALLLGKDDLRQLLTTRLRFLITNRRVE